MWMNAESHPRRWNMRQETRATAAPETPPTELTANIYEVAGGDAYVVEIPVPRLEPEEIDTENVEATLDRGILKIHLPKAAAGKRRIVRVAQKGTDAGQSKRAPESVPQRSPARAGNSR
jgi:HSP20 family molecular chaperone IbpA